MLLSVYRITNPVSAEHEPDLIQVRECLNKREIKKDQV